MIPDIIIWKKQNGSCYFGYLKDVMLFQLSRYSKWNRFRKNMWQLRDNLYRKGISPCYSKDLAMREAQERVNEVYNLTRHEKAIG